MSTLLLTVLIVALANWLITLGRLLWRRIRLKAVQAA